MINPFVPPRYFGVTKVVEFVRDASFIFEIEGKKIPGFVLDLSKTEEICLSGQLLVYKFVSYTAQKRCFTSPRIMWNPDGKLLSQFRKSGFQNILESHIANAGEDKVLRSYKSLKITEDHNYLIVPQRLLRPEESQRTQFEEAFISRVDSFYERPKVRKLVATVLCETITNFWAHATDDTGTVIVARGSRDTCEIVCADNGQGIITTLREAFPALSNMKKEHVLAKAFEKGVTSKPGTFHMGYGLWMIKELIQRSMGRLHLLSEGVSINISNNQVKITPCGYWKGTIVIIQLALNSACSLVDLPELQDHHGINVSWE